MTHLQRFLIFNCRGKKLVTILAYTPRCHLDKRLLCVVLLHGTEELLHRVAMQGCGLSNKLDGDCHNITTDVVPCLRQTKMLHAVKGRSSGRLES